MAGWLVNEHLCMYFFVLCDMFTWSTPNLGFDHPCAPHCLAPHSNLTGVQALTAPKLSNRNIFGQTVVAVLSSMEAAARTATVRVIDSDLEGSVGFKHIAKARA